MKKISIYCFAILFIFHINLQAYSSDPAKFVEELIVDTISKLSDKSLSDEDKFQFIEKIALENVDISALGLYTLGELRKSASERLGILGAFFPCCLKK